MRGIDEGPGRNPTSALCLYYFAIKTLRLKAPPIHFWLNRNTRNSKKEYPTGSGNLLALRLFGRLSAGIIHSTVSDFLDIFFVG